jgi:HPt (histidine-containing phosphotransfer) domain-containing protein
LTTTRPSSATAIAAASAAATPQRRFRASDVATHLDMAVIGDVCVGVGLAGYRSVLSSFFQDNSGSQAALLAALDAADTAALAERAHAIKGAAASLGLRALNLAAARLEAGGSALTPPACADAATELRLLLATARALLQRMGFV